MPHVDVKSRDDKRKIKTLEGVRAIADCDAASIPRLALADGRHYDLAMFDGQSA